MFNWSIIHLKIHELGLCQVLLEPIVTQLVLKVLQLNLFVLSQSCTGVKSLFKEHSIVDISSRAVVIYVSSANIPGVVCCRHSGKSFIQIMNNSGSSIEPWGMPYDTCCSVDKTPFT